MRPFDGRSRRGEREAADLAELLVAVFHQLLRGQKRQLLQMAPHGFLDERRLLRLAPMRAALGLGHDLFDDAERQQILRRDFHRFGRLVRLGRILPENGSGAVGRNDGVDGIFQHQDAVADAKSQRSAAAAFSDDDADDRHAEHSHLAQVARDRLRLAAFLGRIAGISAFRVDEGDDRPLELVGLLHQPQRLAEALRMGTAEEAGDVVLCILAALMADDRHRHSVQLGQAADDRQIVREQPVAVQLQEIREDVMDEVERGRTLMVAGQMHLLGRAELAVHLVLQLLAAGFQTGDLVGEVDARILAEPFQLLDFAAKVAERLLKRQFRRHGLSPPSRGHACPARGSASISCPCGERRGPADRAAG
ncbi:hypothetical protein BN871_HW_00060 [Paenibacillus sp. P22]|nr:hypothetical protein BN871_HW_00060 [Paenibacillus sp. P22]